MSGTFENEAVLETVDSTSASADKAADGAAGRLSAVHPAALRFVAELADDALTLGRIGHDGPALTHKTVSREHVRIEWDDQAGAHVLRDLGSRNGAWVDGVAVSSAWCPLRAGSVVRIGDVVLVYELGHTLAIPDGVEVDRDAVPGDALAIRGLRAQLERVAPDLSPALIIGDTGTGKELLAKELHRLSGREGRFVAINCATLGEQLIESQLFGHIKGAFTGAASDQEGLFRAAFGGTLFLDEIGEMPVSLQPKLLRAIQEREIRPVGSTEDVKVDVRIVAATHRDLTTRARAGDFRQDLYARLSLWELHVPSVVERRRDILGWVDVLYRVWRADRAKGAASRMTFDADAAELLVRADWPENLRGIDRLVHELAADAAAGTIRRRALPRWIEVPS